MNRKIIAAALAATLGLSSLTALAANVPAGVKLADKQELVRHNGTEPDSLDPSLYETKPANYIDSDLFEGLTRNGADGSIQPGVAESWKQTDPRTWVFKLRKDARFSDGSPISADDFVYSWQRTVDPKTGSKYTILHEFILNAKDIVNGKKQPKELGVKALDKYTLEVKTTDVVPFFPGLAAMGNMAPLKKDAIEKNGKDWVKPGKMVSNGAYMLSEWVPNNRVVLVKNPNYWNAKSVVVTKVTYNPVESDDTALKMYKSGEMDWTDEIPTGIYASLKSQFGNELRNTPWLGVYYFNLNNKLPEFQDKRVRQALSMVIDRDILTQKVTGNGETPAYSLFVKGTIAGTPTTYAWTKEPMAQRVAEAKKLLSDAGYGPGKKPLNLKITYNTNEMHKKISLFLASEWKTKLGLATSMENQEFKVFVKTRHDGAYQLARNAWIADYNDATTFLDLVRCGSAQNDTFYCSKTVDGLIAEGNQQTDSAKRTAAYSKAMETAMEDYAVIPMFQYSKARLVKSYVGGYTNTNYLDDYLTQDFYIIKH
ncbi:oligopeptide transport system substrate-binding protein [Silvimonas terrae]|uniref:Oligopeptide transport system substrate-binding protein n=1 Tax=Silvimonas terrae TaxID=300266 RepID=A0A840RCJ6_9NEIS|nr:peptide ABC transporter substrate-binding protein [Silvimonas terrae]MBB5190080.1 oligopeptide transport system substrate-binding protein [Silvimonas terrae]